MAKEHKYVYTFGAGKAEGDASMKNLLGGKGANLAEMCNIGLPVPAGFTIGKRLTRLRVIRLDGHQPVGFSRALIRTVLLMLVVPAMIMDRDLRGLQDKAAGTVVINA